MGDIVEAAELTPEQKAAIGTADNPAEDNEFITRSALPESQLDDDEVAAVKNANDPDGDNHFATMGDLPEVPEFPATQLDDDEVAAIKAADSPGSENPFVTRQEMHEGLQIVPRAAGRLDFSDGAAEAVILGNLQMVTLDETNARFKLSFDGYSHAQSDNYVVNALTVHDHDERRNRIYMIELVRFEADGFVMHMSRIPSGQAELAPGCMIEIKEIM
jgi:hypothetical protein